MIKNKDVIKEIEPGCMVFHCPGCGYGHMVGVKENRPKWLIWGWNGDKVKPTFTPSILVNSHRPEKLCHSFVKEGQIIFLGDCYHDLKGKTVPLPPYDD